MRRFDLRGVQPIPWETVSEIVRAGRQTGAEILVLPGSYADRTLTRLFGPHVLKELGWTWTPAGLHYTRRLDVRPKPRKELPGEVPALATAHSSGSQTAHRQARGDRPE